MKTLRYRDETTGEPQLAILVKDTVYNVTRQVPHWTEPVQMWYALRALGIPFEDAAARLCTGEGISFHELDEAGHLLPPVVAREVWAAGVTYERSREARNAETKISDSVYDRVYAAERPELFFKATADRVVPPGNPLGLRSDSSWMVPEPELSVVISATGDIIGWTVGNDLSSRDIEGENPLYLPQAKVFSRSCSFGPVLLWHTPSTTPADWTVSLEIHREGQLAFSGSVPFRQFRRRVDELVDFLCRDNPVPDGTVLMTGTGIVPPDDFTLTPGDRVDICIDAIGTLVNPIAAPMAL
ncbi:fumarylacetoacetate hydrolase family protein [Alicyclobacillus cycloheptanicus]|uniref:2-dehydro-3-deoxy-D-arabinonate dehydratase n=1 Tax=Alicyclobacillus cycloheptanicus TaxID=1457 RepID=A0ABT9XGU7_9BACL|nr:fumarylacetoacetate hydrolase family protein [Alicyclobacillus cycloheptanicus]MDQ0189522.1 2-dehydro-3-deoxy-D-arabinonate dehydratase [Alicyclobacillus cycloheptanicus]